MALKKIAPAQVSKQGHPNGKYLAMVDAIHVVTAKSSGCKYLWLVIKTPRGKVGTGLYPMSSAKARTIALDKVRMIWTGIPHTTISPMDWFLELPDVLEGTPVYVSIRKMPRESQEDQIEYNVKFLECPKEHRLTRQGVQRVQY